MKETIIVFGRSSCSMCKLANDILTDARITKEYDLLKVDAVTFIKSSKVTEILGMNKSYELLSAITDKFGNEYVLVFKYNPDSKKMAHIPFKKYLVMMQLAQESVDFDQLLSEIKSSPYKEEEAASRTSLTDK